MLTFENVLDDSLLLFLENWTAFAAWIHNETGGGSDQVKVDYQMRQITFLPKLVKRNEVVVPLHLAATVDAENAQWAWANPENEGKPLAMLSTRVRDFGQQQQIAALAEPSHLVPDTGELKVSGHALALAAAACRITGMPVAHLLPQGDAQVVLLLDPAGFFLPAPSQEAFRQLVGNARATGLVQDGRRAVQGYAQARGLGYRWGEGFTHIDLMFPDGELRVEFDDNGQATLSNAGAAEQI